MSGDRSGEEGVFTPFPSHPTMPNISLLQSTCNTKSPPGKACGIIADFPLEIAVSCSDHVPFVQRRSRLTDR